MHFHLTIFPCIPIFKIGKVRKFITQSGILGLIFFDYLES